MDSRMYPVGKTSPKSRPISDVNVDFGVLKNKRIRLTLAQYNAGYAVLPALPGVKWQIFSSAMIAITGNAAIGDSVDLAGTRAGAAVLLAVNAIAGLTRNALLRMGSTDSAILADGASFTPLDSNTAVTVTTAGSPMTTMASLDVLLTYMAVQA